MSEGLLSILLVTSSARGSSLVFRWPPTPDHSSRLSRAIPEEADLDNPWRASHPNYQPSPPGAAHASLNDLSESTYTRYVPDISCSMNSTSGVPASPVFKSRSTLSHPEEYDNVFNYPGDFLASLLCPQLSMCHQKFELIADAMAFIGHPVCAERDGLWRFKLDKSKQKGRGRNSQTNNMESQSSERSTHSVEDSKALKSSQSSWLQTFNLVLVLDLPDPSSSASGNVSKYFEAIYEHIAFPMTAVLFQEQTLGNFVEKECDTLTSLRDDCSSQGQLL